MVKVYIKKQSNYPVSAVKLRKKVKIFFENKGVVSDAQVSVAIVSKKKMLQLGSKFLNEEQDQPPHNVLSFVPDESDDNFAYPKGQPLDLGEIVVCYPVAFQEAKRERKLIDQKVFELVEHGAAHLLGEHHI